MILVFLGKAGSGKGTQAEIAARLFGLQKISPGKLLREEVLKKTRIGKAIEKDLNSGVMVKDKIVNDLVEERLKRMQEIDNFIIDGFPRHLEQALELKRFLRDNGKKILKVLYFKASNRKLIGRLGQRMQCRKCGRIYNLKSKKPVKKGICDFDGSKLFKRKDDSKKGIKKRLEQFKTETIPVVKHFKERGLLVEVNAEKSIQEIARKVEKVLQSL